MTRLFVALHIPDSVKEKIIVFRNEASKNSSQKWERPEKLHLTLKFIGHVAEEVVQPIAEDLKFIEKYPQINLTFTKFGFFFKRNDPKILWIGFEENHFLKELAGEIENSLTKFGIPKEERLFRPHLTLLRIRNKIDNNFLNNFQNYKIKELSFNAEKISLIKSELLKGGSKYTEIKNYFLKG